MSTPSKLSTDSFLSVIDRSGLVDPQRLKKLLDEFDGQGGQRGSPEAVADFLVARNALTAWQSEKLLQGKHKGYFLGKYRLLSLLGRGGMSSVYLAEHILMRRHCAIKVLPAKRVDDSSYLARFHREAQAVAALDHPNIVRAYDVDQQTDRDAEIHFLVMEYVEGTSLQDLVAQQGPLPIADAVDFVRQAAVGLAHAHKAGMVHRDVKPGNLLRDPQGTVKILDLGLARYFRGDEQVPLTLQHDEKVLGTADYLAPEQAIDSHMVDERADIYSLGCTLYFLLTGHPPFTEGALAQRLLAHQNKEPPPLEEKRTDVPTSLGEIVRKMMAKQPDARYATAQAVADALKTWLSANADAPWKEAHADLFRTAGAVAARVVKPLAKAPPAPAPPPAEPELASFLQGLGEPPRRSPGGPLSSKGGSVTPAPSKSPATGSSQKLSPADTLPHQTSPPTAATPATPPPVVIGPPATEASPTDSAPTFLHGQEPVVTPTIVVTPSPSTTAKRPPSSVVSGVRTGSSGVHSAAASGDAETVMLSPATPSPPAARPHAPWRHPALLYGGAGLFLVGVFFATGSLLGWFGGSPPKQPVAKAVPSTDDPPAAVPTKSGPDWSRKRQALVGPQGEFPTITAALDAVRTNFQPQNRSDRFILTISSGTYAERLQLAGKQWPKSGYALNLTVKGDGAVILAPGGGEPVLTLDGVENLQLENISVQADGKPVAIQINDIATRCRLQNVTVSGFTEAGVALRGALGSSFSDGRLVLEEFRFQPGSDQAVGVRATPGSDGVDCGQIQLLRCRFLGPLAAGVSITGKDTGGFEFRECLFAETDAGIELLGGAGWREFVLLNNTFYKGRNGLRVATFPDPERSKNLSVRRNLFVDLSGPETVIEQGFSEPTLIDRRMLGRLDRNWTTSPDSGPQPTSLNLWEHEGQRGVSGVKFASTDPSSPQFLMPTRDAPQARVAGAARGEPQWLGAVGP